MLYTVLLVLKWIILLLILLAIMTTAFLYFAPVFGGKPDSKTAKRIANSPNFNGRTFVNKPSISSFLKDIKRLDNDEQSGSINTLRQLLFPPKGKNPRRPLKTVPLNLIADNQAAGTGLDNSLQDGEFVWLGHSTVLFRTKGKLLITDPVFHSASPLPIGAKPFRMTHTPKVSDLPYIDVVLISHDHYDHLDQKAITELAPKVGHFYVPLGVKAHLLRWGVAEAHISEYDWYESDTIAGAEGLGDIEITFVPARHFSGRRLTGQSTTLWGGWAVRSEQLSVYFSGDGGYSDEFAKIGERFGGFDMAFIEDGAYNLKWRQVHMMPEESAQAGIDVNAKVVLPIHWGKFDLSVHHWREPIRRLKAAFERYNRDKPDNQKVKVATPRIGQVFTLDKLPSAPWWEDSD